MIPPPPISGDLTPIDLDYPRDLQFARGLHEGRLDSWTPLIGCGAPLWAEQGGPFFPLKLLFYLSPTPRAYQWFLALRLVVAALGAWALARRRGLSERFALIAGLLFELSGILVAQLPYSSASPTYLLPWVLVGAEALKSGGRGRRRCCRSPSCGRWAQATRARRSPRSSGTTR